jgi:hypothetical protein
LGNESSLRESATLIPQHYKIDNHRKEEDPTNALPNPNEALAEQFSFRGTEDVKDTKDCVEQEAAFVLSSMTDFRPESDNTTADEVHSDALHHYSFTAGDESDEINSPDRETDAWGMWMSDEVPSDAIKSETSKGVQRISGGLTSTDNDSVLSFTTDSHGLQDQAALLTSYPKSMPNVPKLTLGQTKIISAIDTEGNQQEQKIDHAVVALDELAKFSCAPREESALAQCGFSTPKASPRSTPKASPRSTPKASPRSTPKVSPRRSAADLEAELLKQEQEALALLDALPSPRRKAADLEAELEKQEQEAIALLDSL